MNILPRCNEVVIPIEKFAKYALNPIRDPDKATAFRLALGYDLDNVQKLIDTIRDNLPKFPATAKGDVGYGQLYEVILDIQGENGRTAKVLTAWIDDKANGEMRLVTIHID